MCISFQCWYEYIMFKNIYTFNCSFNFSKSCEYDKINLLLVTEQVLFFFNCMSFLTTDKVPNKTLSEPSFFVT